MLFETPAQPRSPSLVAAPENTPRSSPQLQPPPRSIAGFLALNEYDLQEFEFAWNSARIKVRAGAVQRVHVSMMFEPVTAFSSLRNANPVARCPCWG
jgi:hypothetical protein